MGSLKNTKKIPKSSESREAVVNIFKPETWQGGDSSANIIENASNDKESQSLLSKKRGIASTIITGFRGVDSFPQIEGRAQKKLLGE